MPDEQCVGCSTDSGVIISRVTFNYANCFERRSDLSGGRLVVKGSRVPVRTLLSCLAEGATEAEILADFPTVERAGLQAVIAFAAASARDDLSHWETEEDKDLAEVFAVLENPGEPIPMSQIRKKYRI